MTGVNQGVVIEGDAGNIYGNNISVGEIDNSGSETATIKRTNDSSKTEADGTISRIITFDFSSSRPPAELRFAAPIADVLDLGLVPLTKTESMSAHKGTEHGLMYGAVRNPVGQFELHIRVKKGIKPKLITLIR